ncbi:MAG TPA: alpha/beta hydrolase-fold protein [Cyclobacteriaceae bacterium]|nr:alpha/beta hydrolase-fold protein [Cyclobacteriaceae bacterium]
MKDIKKEEELTEVTPVTYAYRAEVLKDIYTKLLSRNVEVEIMTPPDMNSQKSYPLLLLNDGQDSEAVKVKSAVEKLVEEKRIPEIIVVGIPAADRMQEYGLASRPDYFGRGKLAKAYSDFVTKELLPYLTYKLPISKIPAERAIAGYSLGGLSAMDMVWNHPDLFGKVGVFSGSFWWRKRDAGSFFYSDYRDRLMHLQVRRGKFKPGMKFWFQTGTLDETGDRNKNGVIDSIDDTMDLITELTRKGYRPFHDIQYLEIKDGKHNTETWAEAMPHFLTWAFSNS